MLLNWGRVMKLDFSGPFAVKNFQFSPYRVGTENSTVRSYIQNRLILPELLK